jgi:hypothetical protein
MEKFEFMVVLKVNIDAFTSGDAREAVVEALQDIPGAVVTELLVDQGRTVD